MFRLTTDEVKVLQAKVLVACDQMKKELTENKDSVFKALFTYAVCLGLETLNKNDKYTLVIANLRNEYGTLWFRFLK